MKCMVIDAQASDYEALHGAAIMLWGGTCAIDELRILLSSAIAIFLFVVVALQGQLDQPVDQFLIAQP